MPSASSLKLWDIYGNSTDPRSRPAPISAAPGVSYSQYFNIKKPAARAATRAATLPATAPVAPTPPTGAYSGLPELKNLIKDVVVNRPDYAGQLSLARQNLSTQIPELMQTARETTGYGNVGYLQERMDAIRTAHLRGINELQLQSMQQEQEDKIRAAELGINYERLLDTLMNAGSTNGTTSGYTKKPQTISAGGVKQVPTAGGGTTPSYRTAGGKQSVRPSNTASLSQYRRALLNM